MPKKIFLYLIVLSLFCFCTNSLSASVPELKNVLPHNYEKLDNLATGEFNSFIKKIQASLDIALSLHGELKTAYKLAGGIIYSVYEEKCGDEVFYRVIMSCKKISALSRHILKERNYTQEEYEALRSLENTFIQVLFVKAKDGLCLLDESVYGLWQTEKGTGSESIFYSDFILKDTKNGVGILKLSVNAPIETGLTRDETIHIRYACVDQNPYATQSALYSVIKVHNKNVKDINVPFDKKHSVVEIKASDFYLDSVCPLRYSLLSVFDSREDTIFRENSQENQISMSFEFMPDSSFIETYGDVQITQFALINGVAESRSLYLKNNRIGGFAVKGLSSSKVKEVLNVAEAEDDESFEFPETFTASLQDNMLEMQTGYIPFSKGKRYIIFNTSDMFLANNATHVSISECDIYVVGMGWIFGWNN